MSDPPEGLDEGTFVKVVIIVIVESTPDADEINEILDDGDIDCVSEDVAYSLLEGTIVKVTCIVGETLSDCVDSREELGDDETDTV